MPKLVPQKRKWEGGLCVYTYSTLASLSSIILFAKMLNFQICISQTKKM